MSTNGSFSCGSSIVAALCMVLGGPRILVGSEAAARPQESASSSDEVRFPVAHAHKSGSFCEGYLYISHHSVRYEVVKPDKDKKHSFEIPRSVLKSISQWIFLGNTEQATEIKTDDAVYHFWWMPNEDDLQPGQPSRFKTQDAAAPETLIKALKHPSTVLAGKDESKNESKKQNEESAENADPIGTWSGKHSNAKFTLVLNPDNSGSLNHQKVQWKYSGKILTLKSSEGTYRYQISLSADSMSLTGNDLKKPMVLVRVNQDNLPGLFTPETKADPELPIPGNPPLTQALVDQGIEFFEWLLDAPFTEEQKTQFRNSLVHSWKGHHQDDIDSTMNALKFQEQVKSRPKEEQEIVREQLSQKYLDGIRQTPNATLSKWILNIYDSAHRPIASGNPPLTSQAADAYAEVVAFMIKECLGKQALNANRKFKDLLAKSMAAQYPNYSPEQRRVFSQMPLLWKALRYKWPQLSQKEKQEFRKQWAPLAQNMLSGPPGQSASSEQPASSDDCDLPQFSCNSDYSEHQFVENMINSSFASTISMHMSVFR